MKDIFEDLVKEVALTMLFVYVCAILQMQAFKSRGVILKPAYKTIKIVKKHSF
jgi:hypothetical protein